MIDEVRKDIVMSITEKIPQTITLLAPVSGLLVPITDVPDKAFFRKDAR